ncbi:uncharacterized protein LOC21402088 [Morus notabilis]|uniref:uncharacterized protein LOC21402088 n=1 Tax=Morus notabilis TaxID=981085 RepID=UPI000CED0677|nr:uncharacterized protein LOC21402088 [Morus notabilis]
MLSDCLDKFLMSFLLRKIHCPSFICFCKPSPHIYTPGPLKLENSPNVPKKPVTVPDHNSDSDNQLPGDSKVIKEEEEEILDGKQEQFDENCLKSNLRKPNSDSANPAEKPKKRVQWTDLLGKELVEIREFESSEIEDTDNEAEDNRGCMCVIL